jgi:hypothetical protein
MAGTSRSGGGRVACLTLFIYSARDPLNGAAIQAQQCFAVSFLEKVIWGTNALMRSAGLTGGSC